MWHKLLKLKAFKSALVNYFIFICQSKAGSFHANSIRFLRIFTDLSQIFPRLQYGIPKLCQLKKYQILALNS